MKQVITLLLKVIFVFWLIGIVLCIIFVKNPFWVHRIDASVSNTQNLEDIYSEKTPYVKVKHADLEYTGFYSVNDDEIMSYCFVCTVGDYSYLVELSADKVYDLTTDPAEGIKDVSFMGKMTQDDQLIQMLAEDEGTDAAVFCETYGISNICIYQYQNDYEQVVIYYILAVLVGGIILTGAVTIKQKKTRSAYEE